MSPFFSIASVNFLDILIALNLQSFKENVFMSNSSRGLWLVKLVQFHLPSGNIYMGIISDISQSSLFPAGCITMYECRKALLNGSVWIEERLFGLWHIPILGWWGWRSSKVNLVQDHLAGSICWVTLKPFTYTYVSLYPLHFYKEELWLWWNLCKKKRILEKCVK